MRISANHYAMLASALTLTSASPAPKPMPPQLAPEPIIPPSMPTPPLVAHPYLVQHDATITSINFDQLRAGPVFCARVETKPSTRGWRSDWLRDKQATKDCCHWSHQDVGDTDSAKFRFWNCVPMYYPMFTTGVNVQRMGECCAQRGRTAVLDGTWKNPFEKVGNANYEGDEKCVYDGRGVRTCYIAG